MGLLDSVLGAALGGGGQANNPQAALLNAVVGMLAGGGQQGGAGGGMGGMLGQVLGSALGGGGAAGGAQAGGLGGLAGLVEKFGQAGLGDVAKSWVGTGQNMPVSADQLGQVLGGDTIGNLANQLGMSHGDVLGQLSQMLPQVVDKLTPNGQIPQGDIHGMDMGMIGNVLGGLLKR